MFSALEKISKEVERIGYFCFIAFLPLTAVGGSVETVCFDVGQGNLALVLAKKNDGSEAAMCLVDGGSTSGCNKQKVIADVVKKIMEFSKDIPTQPSSITVVVSHPDIDHYNLLPKIISLLSNEKIVVSHMYLGGVKSHYKSTFYKYLEKIEESSSQTNVCYPTSGGPTNGMKTIIKLCDKNITCALCPALPILNETEKNDGSIVLLVNCYGKKLLITGDATKKTTNHILSNCPSMEVDILFVSHHGASSDGSNDSSWVDATKPSYALCSSGARVDYRHPRSEVVRPHVAKLSMKTPDYHPVPFGMQKNEDKKAHITHEIISESGKTTSYYGILFTNKGFYSTLGNGTIIVMMRKNDGEPSVVEMPAIERSSLVKQSLLDSLEATLYQGINTQLTFQHIVELNLDRLTQPGYGSLDNDLDERFKWLDLFQQILEEMPPNLKTLSLKNNDIIFQYDGCGGNDFEGTLAYLIAAQLVKNDNFQDCYLLGNDLPHDQKALIKACKNKSKESLAVIFLKALYEVCPEIPLMTAASLLHKITTNQSIFRKPLA